MPEPLVIMPKEVELLPPEHPAVEVVALPHPFSMARQCFALEPGLTVADLVQRAGIPDGYDARVLIESGGLVYGPIPRWQWARIRPRPGRRVIIRAIPRGGGGGDKNKTTRLILQIVIVLVAIVVIYFVPVAAPLVGLLVAGAFLAVNMLLPPQFPKLGKLANLNNASGKAPESPALSITGTQNKANPYGPVPKVYGRHRIFGAAREAIDP
jgi:hypothetical protein